MSAVRPVRRWAARAGVIDGAVVAVVFGFDVVGQALATAGHDVKSAPLSAAAVLLAAANAGVLWWRRRRPLAVFVGLVVLAVVASGAVEPGLASQQTGATAILGTYACGSWSEHRRWAAALPAVLLVLLIAGGLGDGSGVVETFAAALTAVGLPWVAGYAARSRRLYVEEVEHRLAEAERERDERARRAVIDERTHIARELHDVVAHHVSLIGVQAGAARTALDRSPETTRAALRAIEDSSRSAVGEMRHLLDVLRADGDPAEVVPQPGLGDLDRLVQGFRAAGIDVTLDRRGRWTLVPPLLGLCCYRVVEEALTNVARHSAAGRAAVEIDQGPVVLRIVVCDPGPTRPGQNGSGRGLVGMGERVALFGGSLVVGPTADGGFRVMAAIPLGGVP